MGNIQATGSGRSATTMAEPIKFLLVDDHVENLIALEALVRRDGLEVLVAQSGSEALELLLKHDVSLALLDVQMPEMDGYELATLMRGAKRTKHVPIIFVTADARVPWRMFTGYSSGPVDFLFKPIVPNILKDKAAIFFELGCKRRDFSQAVRLNELFVGTLGHDLMEDAEALRQQIVDDSQLRTLARMAAGSHRMKEMIAQLLELTRALLAGGVAFPCAHDPIDIGVLVRRAIDELQATSPGLDVVIEASGDCTTGGDPDRLVQLFSNLVGNALHHGTPGMPCSVRIAGGERRITIQVHNQGVIPPERLPSIFELLRGRTNTAPPHGGLGIGLFISQQIARAHDGDLAVVSNSASGTVFTVHLPRRRE